MEQTRAIAGLSKSELEKWLAEPSVAALAASGAPLVVAAGEPARVVWANAAAQGLFRASTLESLSSRVFSTARLAEVAQNMRPGAPPRLERVRLTTGRAIDTLTFMCRRSAGSHPLTLFAAMGVRPGLYDGGAASAPLSVFASQPVGSLDSTVNPPVVGISVLQGETAAQTSAASQTDSVAAPLCAEPAAQTRRDAGAVANDLSARFQGASVVRFLWKTDAGHRLTEITGQLCEVVGCDSARLIARSFVDVAEELGVDPLYRLASAFAQRETWSGLDVAWPIVDADASVPVTLGALPVFNRDRAFEGFRGFGVVHIQRVEPCEKNPAAPETIAGDDLAKPAQAPAAQVPDAHAADSETPAASAADHGAHAPETDMHNADAGAAQSAFQEQTPQFECIDPANSAEIDDEADALDLEPSEPQPERSFKTSGRMSGANVVPLRAAYRVATPSSPIQPPPAANDAREAAKSDLPGAAPVKPSEPPNAQPASPTVELTAQERNAFREIARVLGVKAEAQAQIQAEFPKRGADNASRDAAPPQAPEPVRERERLRVRDLIDLKSEAAPEVGEAELTAPVELSLADAVPAPAAPRHADQLARHASALLDRLPVGVLVSRMEIPIYVNRNLLDLLDFKDADAFYAAGGLDRMFRGRQPEALTEAAGGGAIPLVTRAGDVVSVIARVQSIDWDNESASLMTFRETREADLAPRVRSLESEARHRDGELRELHAILDTATDGVVVLDSDGLILALNRSAEALFGYDQNEVAGENFTFLLGKESHASANDYLAGLKSNGVASVLNDGRDVTGRARQGGAMPMFMTLGRVSTIGAQKFCAVLRDMTAWKKAERELNEAKREAERASALKSDFLAKVSHEVRTPLNAILGFAEVIMEERFGPVGNERYKDYLKDIHSSGVHVMSLVNDLLDLSKIEAGKLELDFGSVDANRIVSECVSIMQPQATRERVIIRQSLAPRLPNIVADERSLRQIVLNLLSNALKFNEVGGQVIVSTALTDAGHAVIRIKDTGVGMNEAEVQTAMEPFRQLHTSRNRGGTGLGLPLTKSLVEANRASFTIKSKKKEGTLVEVAFPPTRVLAE